MAYTYHDFRTKKALKEALARGEDIRVYQPTPWGNKDIVDTRIVALEGPHYPRPHSWYATAHLKDGRVVKVY